MAAQTMSLKLLVDKKGQRVLFAEATKEFVDFLFHIFSLPLGTLVELLGSNQMVGSLGKLKESIDGFDETYLQPGIKKDDIFNPKTTFNSKAFLPAYDAPAIDQSAASKTIYSCSRAHPYCRYCCSSGLGCRSYATVYENSICPSCNGSMDTKINVVVPKEVEKAEREAVVGNKYVKELVTYMVVDDLVVKPMSTISSITLLNKFGVKDLSQLEEMTVSFGKEEGLKLLKASLSTDKVLTSVFLN